MVSNCSNCLHSSKAMTTCCLVIYNDSMMPTSALRFWSQIIFLVFPLPSTKAFSPPFPLPSPKAFPPPFPLYHPPPFPTNVHPSLFPYHPPQSIPPSPSFEVSQATAKMFKDNGTGQNLGLVDMCQLTKELSCRAKSCNNFSALCHLFAITWGTFQLGPGRGICKVFRN